MVEKFVPGNDAHGAPQDEHAARGSLSGGIHAAHLARAHQHWRQKQKSQKISAQVYSLSKATVERIFFYREMGPLSIHARD